MFEDALVVDEVAGCVREISDRLGISRPHFTYPYGRSNENTHRLLHDVPIRSAISTEPMKLVTANSDTHGLTRVDANVGLSQLGFLTSGAYPAMINALKSRIRK